MARTSRPGAGRFAPSPTGALHLGNLRTALVAFLSARSQGLRFVVRMDDLDPNTARREHERGQLEDLAAIGISWDGVVMRQSEHLERYGAAVAQLEQQGRVYECFCTRREIREAAVAPHGELPEGAYPGTCRGLTPAERRSRRSTGRPSALRLRADGDRVEFDDRVAGRIEGPVDDLVLRRNDGVPAYNLAVVVDDAAQGITEVCRGNDLLSSTPRQIYLARLLGLPSPAYAHVPLVLAPDGSRLAKRHGAVTLAELREHGHDGATVRGRLAHRLGLAEPGERPSIDELVVRFSMSRLPSAPWIVSAEELAAPGGC